jgi:hypothetical protein
MNNLLPPALQEPISNRPALWTPRFAGLFAFAAAAGIAIVQAVGRSVGPARPPGEYFLSWQLERAFANGGLAGLTIGLLATVGLACGLTHPRRAWLLGFASVALFPAVVAVEFAADSTSHNLVPFEIVMFAFLALPAVAGAGLGALLRGLAERIGART